MTRHNFERLRLGADRPIGDAATAEPDQRR